jgi:FkbM family methyltransferase
MKNFLNKIIKKNKFSIVNLVEKYKIKRNIVLHVGGNVGQEIELYEGLGFDNIIWIEGWPPFADELEKKLKAKSNHKVIRAMISDIGDEYVEFSLASNKGSSTALQVTDNWKKAFSTIDLLEKKRVRCKRLDELLEANGIYVSIDFMVMDIEGSELKALRSMGEGLRNVSAALVEFSIRENYINGPLLSDIDMHMINFGFKRVYIKMGAVSGDALYIQSGVVNFMEKIKMYCSFYVLRFLALCRLTDLLVIMKRLVERAIANNG